MLIVDIIYFEPQVRSTVCPGSSDPPEKVLNIFASENEFTPFFNYYDILV